MGARQSKRSVDITTTPRKGDGDNIMEGEGKVEKINDVDSKATTNGSLLNEIELPNKETEVIAKDTEDVKENGVPESDQTNTSELNTDQVLSESPAIEKSTELSSDKAEEVSEGKKNKDKSKKKKWSFRSISFSRKDKSKPGKDSDKVTEDVENAVSQSNEPTTAEEEIKIESSVNGEAALEELTKTNDEKANNENDAEGHITRTDSNKPLEASKEEPKPEELPNVPVEEPRPVEPHTVIEETKEVRNDDVPPPLPTSNPPSPVMVFAESTKADASSEGQIPVSVQTPPSFIAAPVIETIPEQSVIVTQIQTTPELVSPPATENILEQHSAPVVESIAEPVPLSDSTVNNETPSQDTLHEQETLLIPLPESHTAPQSLTVSLEKKTLVEETCILNNASSLCHSPVDDKSKDLSLTSEPKEDDVEASENKYIINTNNENTIHNTPDNHISKLQEDTGISQISDISSSSTDYIKKNASETITEPIQVIELDSQMAESCDHVDSFPDVSIESLPSLPEPISESLQEPMSLPPVESIPAPIAPECLDASSRLSEQAPISEIPIPNEKVLTNGSTNGESSPLENEVTLPSIDGHIKQVVTEAKEIAEDIRQENDKMYENEEKIKQDEENASAIKPVEPATNTTTAALTAVEE